MSSQVTMYACGHTWNTGFNGTPEEQERLKKIVNEKWSKEPCVYCQHFKQEQEMQALDKQLEQTAWAMRAFRRQQATEPTWEEGQRRVDYERFMYCGYED